MLPETHSGEHKFKVLGVIVSNGATPLDLLAAIPWMREGAQETWGTDQLGGGAQAGATSPTR